MSKSTAIKTLIELASKESDTAAQNLGRQIRTTEELEQKLALLMQYRNDYDARFHASRTEGLTMAGYRNFQSFLEKLDVAIESQQQIVEEAQQRVADGKKAWQEAEKKKMSYSTLSERQQKEIVRKEMKWEQKQTDEFVTNKLHYKR